MNKVNKFFLIIILILFALFSLQTIRLNNQIINKQIFINTKLKSLQDNGASDSIYFVSFAGDTIWYIKIPNFNSINELIISDSLQIDSWRMK